MKFKCNACGYNCELSWGNNLVPIRCPENYNKFKWVSIEDADVPIEGDEDHFVIDGVMYAAIYSETWECHPCEHCAFDRNTCFALQRPHCNELCRKDRHDVYFIELAKVHV